MLDSNREGIMNETDTCRTYVLPKLKSAGWEDESPALLLSVLDRKIVQVDEEIDRKVYELYELTDDEIKIVEGG